MKINLSTILALVAGGFLMASSSLFAHHAAAGIYNQKREVTYQATVKEFQFTNPHAQLYFEVKAENGAVENWQGEMSPANNLRRQGWTRNRLKPGDKITVVLHVASNGSKQSDILDILVDGKNIYRSRD